MNTIQFPEKIKDESEIIWLKPKENYDYLREVQTLFSFRSSFPLKALDPSTLTDGGSKAHIVAYSNLKPEAKSNGCGNFYRRYWWVKSWDRWKGHCNDKGFFYNRGCPCEAVRVESIIAGQVSVEGCKESDDQSAPQII